MYIDAKLINGKVFVSERDADGIRHVRTHLPPYMFYYKTDGGKHTSIYGDKLEAKRFTTYTSHKNTLQQYREAGKVIFESDVDPVFRLLEERYPVDDEIPDLHIGVFDIEVDKDPARGWSSTTNPYAAINAVSTLNKHTGVQITLAVPPPTLSFDEAQELLNNDSDEFGALGEDNWVFLCRDEAELLETFLDTLGDIDVLTGWNSEFYDIPYIVSRIRITLGGEDSNKFSTEDGSLENPFSPNKLSQKYLRKLGLFNTIPTMKQRERYGKKETTYSLSGRIHLDYLDLYQKFTFEELHSYRLDFVLDREIHERKLEYDGTLDELYRNDFKRFVAYNIQDVAGLSKLDDKMKLIGTANNMAHMAGVTLDKALGSVVIIEQSVLRRLHRNKKICFDRDQDAKKGTIPGAYVVDPIKGMYKWICSFDIASLYPSVIRSLNISPEVIIGQFLLTETEAELERRKAETLLNKPNPTPKVIKDAEAAAWKGFTGVLEYHHIIDADDAEITLVLEGSHEELTHPAHVWKDILENEGWNISGYGTVFSGETDGIIAECLTDWYEVRAETKAKASTLYKSLADIEDPTERATVKEEADYYDGLQLVRKIFLNSLYGSFLSRYFRFYDPRLGASVTLTGRGITKHMCRKSCEVMTGNYSFDRNALIAGDTDSAYCTMDYYLKTNNIGDDPDTIIKIADGFGKEINDSFPKFMHDNYLVSMEHGAIIQADREVVAKHGMFKDVKKRYALHVINDEGKIVDKMKIMGMETRRSDTPAIVQDFLESCISMTVKDQLPYQALRDYVDEFRTKQWRARDTWLQGTPCRVSNLTSKSKAMANYERSVAEGIVGIDKPRVHFSVVAADNTNKLMELMEERRWDVIHDGDKIEVLPLLDNPYGFKTVARKVDDEFVPDWFKELPFDSATQEFKMLDKKLDNVIGSVLGWTFEPITDFRDEVFEEESFF